MFDAVVGRGDSRSGAAWMWCSSGARPRLSPCATSPRGTFGVASSSGTSIDIRYRLTPRKRYALEQVVGDAVGLVGDPDAVSGRKGPVDLHVGEHVLLGEWRAVEGESEIPAHQAVRAVASHEIACCDDTVTARIADGGTDAIPVLGEAEEFAAPLDCDTEAGQVLAKEPLRLVLR